MYQKPIVTCLLAVLCLASSVNAKPGKRPASRREGWELVWHDEFGGRKLSDEWTRIPRFPNPSEWNKYMSSDDRLYEVRGGKLILYGRTNDFLPGDTAHFLTGGVYTRGKVLFQRGRIDIRLRMDDASGAWPAAWLLPEGRWPHDGEIDIMEYAISTQGKDKSSSSIHCNAFNWPAGTQITHVQAVSGAASQFHVYALEWSADKMVFYVDGKAHLTFQNDGKGYDHWPFDAPFYLKLNQAWGGNMGGATDESQFPAVYEVDYVRVFQKD